MGLVQPKKRVWGHRTRGAGVQTDGLERLLPQQEPALRPLGLGVQPPEGRSGKVRSVSRRPVGWARQTRKRTKLSFNSMKYKGSKMNRNLAEKDTQAAGKPVKRRSHLQSLEVCRLNPKEGASGTKLNSKIFKKGPFQVWAKLVWTAQAARPQWEGREVGWSVKVGVPPPPGPASPTRSSGGPAPSQPHLEVSARLHW